MSEMEEKVSFDMKLIESTTSKIYQEFVSTLPTIHRISDIQRDQSETKNTLMQIEGRMELLQEHLVETRKAIHRFTEILEALDMQRKMEDWEQTTAASGHGRKNTSE